MIFLEKKKEVKNIFKKCKKNKNKKQDRTKTANCRIFTRQALTDENRAMWQRTLKKLRTLKKNFKVR